MTRFASAAANLVAAVVLFVGCRRGATLHDTPTFVDSGREGDAAAPTASAPPTGPPNMLPLPAASIEAQINPEKLPPYTGPTGSVEGTIYVKGPDAPEVGGVSFGTCPAAIDTYGKLFRAGPANAAGLRPLADAVIVVAGYTGFYVPAKQPSESVTIGADCGYPQRSITMTFGQRLEIANDSKVGFAPSLQGSFQPAIMIAPPLRSGDPVKLYPPKPGHYLLTDALQPFVHEDVYVFRQPLHAVTDLGGHYRIDGVPTTKVRVGALLDVLRSEAQKVIDVRPNVVERVDLVLTYTPHDGGVVMPHVIP